jgi:hypothetical protein
VMHWSSIVCQMKRQFLRDQFQSSMGSSLISDNI